MVDNKRTNKVVSADSTTAASRAYLVGLQPSLRLAGGFALQLFNPRLENLKGKLFVPLLAPAVYKYTYTGVFVDDSNSGLYLVLMLTTFAMTALGNDLHLIEREQCARVGACPLRHR